MLCVYGFNASFDASGGYSISKGDLSLRTTPFQIMRPWQAARVTFDRTQSYATFAEVHCVFRSFMLGNEVFVDQQRFVGE
jgi:hypothetical protein